MFKTLLYLIDMFWLCDVMNMPFMEAFDNEYPLNGMFWFLASIIRVLYLSYVNLEVSDD